MTPDIGNALFELIGGFLIWLSVRKLYIDKEIKGVHWAPILFFCLWGYWNLFYYSHLDQWYSWAAGINVTLANTVWVGQILYYTLKDNWFWRPSDD